MRFKFVLLVILFSGLHLFSVAQELTFGPVSGINFSNLRGEMTYNSWSAKPGPVNGIFAKTTLGNWLALKTGAEFTSFYYQERWNYTGYYTGIVPTDNSYSSSSFAPGGCIIGPPSPNSWDFHFLRVPLMLEWKTPGRLSFGFGAGAHYSFLLNDEFTGKDKDLHSEEFREENFPPGTDWGWLLSASLNYAVNSRWNIFLEGRTTYGKEVYLESDKGKNGSSELLFGVGFSPFSKPAKAQDGPIPGRRLEMMPHVGISFSKSIDPDKKSDYAALPALNSGIAVKFKPDSAFSIISGVWVERKGYRIEKPSHSRIYYASHVDFNPPVTLQSDVSLDYLTIPLLGDVMFGKRFTTNIQFGLYYSMLQNARATGQETDEYNYNNGYRIQREYFSENVEGWFKNDDFGAITGLRFEYRIFLKTKIYVALNRAWGFTKLGDDSEDDNSEPAPAQLENFKNRSWTASFGLAIPVAQN
jgi:hypothetical protein